MHIDSMTALPNWGLLEIAGPDAKTFLQGQITCHMGELPSDKAQLAGHCNLKGRLESLFYIFELDSSVPIYVLMMPRTMISHAAKQFKKYALFSKITITDRSDTMPLIGIFGKTASSDRVRHFPGNDHRSIMICHNIEAFNTYTPPDLSLQWEQADIEAGFPMIYPETIDTFLPHNLNLDDLGALSFNKGCYLGQEIIARMHYKGNIKKHLYKNSVNLPTPPLPGSPISDGILVRCLLLDNHTLALAVIEDFTAHQQGWFACKN